MPRSTFAVAMALLLAVCLGAVEAKTYDVKWRTPKPVIDGVPRHQISICAGSTLKVHWKDAPHSLWTMDGWSCAARDAQQTPPGPETYVETATAFLQFPNVGTYYFSSQHANDCQNGLRLKVVVKALKDCLPRPGDLTSRRRGKF